jgi:hypothetical protein
MPDEIASDEIDEAEILLCRSGAMSQYENFEESTSLSTRAIGLLLLYFAKEHHDTTKKIEGMIARKTERKLAELDKWLALFMSSDMPGGK